MQVCLSSFALFSVIANRPRAVKQSPIRDLRLLRDFVPRNDFSRVKFALKFSIAKHAGLKSRFRRSKKAHCAKV